MRSRRRAPVPAFLVAMALWVVACTGEGGDDRGATTTESGPAAVSTGGAGTGTVEGEVVVLAAASLTDAFTAVGEAFEEANPDATITFGFAASSQLATQLAEGAPGDVFASADEVHMQRAVDAGVIAGLPQVFARNVLAIVVPAPNTRGITALEDLYRPSLRLALCAPEVPCGRYAVEAFEKARLGAPPPASQEQNVRGVLTKVVAGEADAGIVYRTDVTAAGDAVEGVEIPAEVNVDARYPLAVVADAPNGAGAAAFVAFVRSPEGMAILESFGFLPP